MVEMLAAMQFSVFPSSQFPEVLSVCEACISATST